jgi:predicted ATPase
LAVEAADRIGADFEDGVTFVKLAGNRDPALVAAIVAHAVGVRQSGDSPVEALKNRLRNRQALLVLDTFEHLLDAAPMVGEVVAACPRITVLVTSRAALRLRGERDILLDPLGLPADGLVSDMHDLQRYPAIALFVERARAAGHDVGLDREIGPIVAEVCRRVDGLPLAIELAAARVKHLTLGALRDQLQHRLRVLTGGPRDLPPRQQAMRDTVAWSYELLAPSERQLFRQLSIFAGGWTLDAAEFVCVSGALAVDALTSTSALIDNSLVFVAAAPGAGAHPRYGMLDTIREYAAERRDAGGDSNALGRRHAEHFLGVAETAEPELGGTEQGMSFRRLDDDHENLRAALRWSLDKEDAEIALRLAGALWQFWRRRGDIAEGRSWLEEALSLRGAAESPARGKALWGAGWLAYHQGDFERSGALGAELQALALGRGDRLAERNGLTILGKVAVAEGRFQEAIEPSRAALAICQELGPGWLVASSVFNLGTAMLLAGESAHAEELIGEARVRYRELGDAYFVARTTGYLAYPALLGGDLKLARSLTTIGLRMSLELADSWGIAEGMERISAAIAASGDASRAARVAGAARAVRDTIALQPMPEDQAMIGPYLADARSRLGEQVWEEAWARGRSMPFVDAVEDALGSTDPLPAG